MKTDTGKSENRRRLDSWADVLIRNKKIASSWKEDEEIADLVRSIADPKAEVPGQEKAGKPKTAKLKR